jgi:hypothetical protein
VVAVVISALILFALLALANGFGHPDEVLESLGSGLHRAGVAAAFREWGFLYPGGLRVSYQS